MEGAVDAREGLWSETKIAKAISDLRRPTTPFDLFRKLSDGYIIVAHCYCLYFNVRSADVCLRMNDLRGSD
jgi:hypothetical protein